jgi:hypothetical protein
VRVPSRQNPTRLFFPDPDPVHSVLPDLVLRPRVQTRVLFCPDPQSFPVFESCILCSSSRVLFGVLFSIASHISTRAASSLPDGDYDVTPREQQTDAQLNQAEVAQELTVYQEIPAAIQTEGKPRCILPYVKTTRIYVTYVCIRSKCCLKP